MSTKQSTSWLTRTSLALALVVLSQFIGKMIPAGAVIMGPVSVGQIITGSLVNLMLIMSVLLIDLKAGVTVGILSAILATLLGIGPIFPIITPAIAAGNAILVIVVGLGYARSHSNNLGRLAAIALGAVAKCGFLWYTVPKLFAFIPEIKPPQAAALGIMFSWPQLVTAMIGGLIAMMIYPVVKKAVN